MEERANVWGGYVSLLARACESLWSDRCWNDLHKKHQEEQLEITERLILIHPKWYGGEKRVNCPVRHNRDGFPKGQGNRGACESSLHWGYDCPWPGGEEQYDHWFPYSFGGPTDLANSSWLCKWHNESAKGSDFHVLDPRPERLTWFDATLRRVEIERATHLGS